MKPPKPPLSSLSNSIDLLNIKLMTGLITAPDQSFIAIAQDAIEDTSGNGIATILNVNAVQVATVVVDITSPILLTYSLDMDNGVLSMSIR